MPLSRQIRSKSTSPPLPNRSVNCLPLSVSTSSGTPNRVIASANARHTARPVARRTTLADTQYREWSSTPVTTFSLRPRRSARPRRRCPSATAASARAAPTAGTRPGAACAASAAISPCRTRIRYTVIRDGTRPGQPSRPSSNAIRTRPPPRMLPAHLTHRRLHRRLGLPRTRRPAGVTSSPTRPDRRRGSAASQLCTACRDTPNRAATSTTLDPGQDHQHRLIPLLHNRHLHQRQSRPPTTRAPANAT